MVFQFLAGKTDTSFFFIPTCQLPRGPTPQGKGWKEQVRVPVRYCMLGSRDSARSDTPYPLEPRPHPRLQKLCSMGLGDKGRQGQVGDKVSDLQS